MRTPIQEIASVFLRLGGTAFGGPAAHIAMMEAEVVRKRGWLTHDEFLDAVAVGQVTPGPVFTTATFIGYVLGGWPGAIVATVGIFLPAFIFVALSIFLFQGSVNQQWLGLFWMGSMWLLLR